MREVDPKVRTCLHPFPPIRRRVQGSTRQPVMADDQLAVVAADMVLLVFIKLFIQNAHFYVKYILSRQSGLLGFGRIELELEVDQIIIRIGMKVKFVFFVTIFFP